MLKSDFRFVYFFESCDQIVSFFTNSCLEAELFLDFLYAGTYHFYGFPLFIEEIKNRKSKLFRILLCNKTS